MNGRRFDLGGKILPLILIVISFITVVCPIFTLLSGAGGEAFTRLAVDARFFGALLNSILLTSAATLIVLVMACALAWCMVRTNMRGKFVFDFIFVLPMLIPSISHGIGMIIVFGRSGLLTSIIGLDIGITGVVGIILGSVMYAFPAAYIMICDILRYEDKSVYEAAEVLGIGKKEQFLRITLPFLRRPLIAVTFSIFALIVTDYGVPIVVGGTVQTISRLMYDACIGFEHDLEKGSLLGLILLVPAVIAFLLDAFAKERASSSFVKREFSVQSTKTRDALAFIYSGLVAVFALLPVIAFIFIAGVESYPYNLLPTLANVTEVLRRNGGTYLVNSLEAAFLAASIGTVLAFVIAYLTARMKTKASKLLHLIVISTLAVPGMVIGLSYLMTFHDSVLFGTLAIIVTANVVHFVAPPYLMMVSSLRKLSENLEAVGATLGISRLLMIRDVFLPQSRTTLAEMFLYLFVNSMMTISAVVFLSTTDTKPLSLMINQFGEFKLGCAAVVSLIILLVNVTAKLIVALFKTRRAVL